MSRFRKHLKNNNYTIVDNEFLRDINLSLKDRGLLLTMLSLPEDWDFSIKGLSSILSDGEWAVRTSLKSLEDNGYLQRIRIIDEKGKILDWEYLFSDEKLPLVENPHVENPQLGNRTQLNTKESNTKELCCCNNGSADQEIIENPSYVEQKNSDQIGRKKQDNSVKLRIIEANKEEILRINEANRSEKVSGEIVRYLSDSCNCFGLRQLKIIRKLPDDDFRKLFRMAADIIAGYSEFTGISNPKAYLSSEIKKCAAGFRAKERT